MKKRIFSIMMCLCMVLMLFSVTVFAEEPLGILKGDVNYDGELNIRDATLLLQRNPLARSRLTRRMRSARSRTAKSPSRHRTA